MERRGHACVRAAPSLWEDPVPAEVLRFIILTAAQEPVAVVSRSLPDAERNLRASLVSTQIVGMVMNRYIWQVGTIADLPAPAVADLIAPTIQHYLTGPLPPGLGDDGRGPG